MVTDGRKTEEQIPLKAKSKVTSRKRLELVNRDEDSIKKGLKFSFPWLNDEGINKIVILPISEAIEQWLNHRKSEGIRSITIKRNRCSLGSLMSHIGTSFPLLNQHQYD